MFCSQGHDEVPDVLDPAANNDVVFSQLGILECLEADILLVDWLRVDLAHVYPISFYVL